MQNNYDILVVGTGFSGSIIARELAQHDNQRVLVIEQRSHIGGNMYDEYDENGILIQKYGPHFLLTDKYWIIEYVSKFTELYPHTLKALSFIDGNYVRLPYNFESVKQLTSPVNAESLLHLLRKHFAGRERVPVIELMEHSNDDIRAYGMLLFTKAYRTYIEKFWGCEVEKLDRVVIERVPLAMNYDERYADRDFQYLPLHGFTKLFENMLGHPNIELRLGVNAIDGISFNENNGSILYNGAGFKAVVYTGAIDELFGECFGSLPYRSLDIHYQTEKAMSVLPEQVIIYPQADGYTRSTEYRKISYLPLDTPYSTVATEYPVEYNKHAKAGNLPYYPVINKENNDLYEKYKIKAEKYKNLILCGRLAEFKYYNMDAVIERAFEKLAEIRELL